MSMELDLSEVGEEKEEDVKFEEMYNNSTGLWELFGCSLDEFDYVVEWVDRNFANKPFGDYRLFLCQNKNGFKGLFRKKKEG